MGSGRVMLVSDSTEIRISFIAFYFNFVSRNTTNSFDCAKGSVILRTYTCMKSEEIDETIDRMLY